jgi:hypothetical protein
MNRIKQFIVIIIGLLFIKFGLKLYESYRDYFTSNDPLNYTKGNFGFVFFHYLNHPIILFAFLSICLIIISILIKNKKGDTHVIAFLLSPFLVYNFIHNFFIVAALMVLASIIFFDSGNYIEAGILALLAATIHTTALLIIPYFLIKLYFEIDYTKKGIEILAGSSKLILGLIIGYVILMFFNHNLLQHTINSKIYLDAFIAQTSVGMDGLKLASSVLAILLLFPIIGNIIFDFSDSSSLFFLLVTSFAILPIIEIAAYISIFLPALIYKLDAKPNKGFVIGYGLAFAIAFLILPNIKYLYLRG